MNHYFHSVSVDESKCQGRMKCMHICPTEAIRVRGGKAKIDIEKCIDCGECINACPSSAIIPLTDPFGELTKFRHTVAIPSPALYAQFGQKITPGKILNGLKKLGFDDAYDLAFSCGEVSFAIQEYLRENKDSKPLIINTCPTVVRLIQVKYPSLINHITPIDIPREIAGREVKQRKSKQYGLKEKEIGAFYITPCPAKMISIKQPAEKEKSFLDGAISISDIYGPLLSAMENEDNESAHNGSVDNLCILGAGWAMVGGISRTLKLTNSLSVSGLPEILKVFDDIERGKLKHIDFIEAYSCLQGCIGGSLTVENLYISYNKILRLIEELELKKIKNCPDIREVRKKYSKGYFFKEHKLHPRPIKPLNDDLTIAIRKRKEKEKLYKKLPKIDCGACGSPTCLAFAEDVVKNEVSVLDCVFMLPKKLKELSQDLSDLLDKSKSKKNPGHNKKQNKGKGK
ncbi:MAG: 4Fe-4S dicluster domain-containing protein [Candidatus Aminicenantes bacterium]|nr:4Fe-4S dicluster domain-containing protein [Candidatus Aminicenantes bacterium]